MRIYLCLFVSLVSGLSEIKYCFIEDETSTFESMYITCSIQLYSSQPRIYSVNFTSINHVRNDASRIEINCTSYKFYSSVRCNIKVNTTNLQSGFYDIRMIASAQLNNSHIVTEDIRDIKIYVPKELETPECEISSYGAACSVNPMYKIESSYISCVAAIPVAKVNCTMMDTSKSDYVTITSYEATYLYAFRKDGINVYSARCDIPFNTIQLMDVLKVNVTFSYDNDYNNTSLVSYTSASFSVGCPKGMNFTVNANPDGVCVNIGDNVTFSCITDVPPQHKVLRIYGRDVDFPDKTMTLKIKDTSSYGYYMCNIDDYSDYLQKTVYVFAPAQTTRKGEHTFYELHYTGINNDTAFALIGIYGCPEPTAITVLKKIDEDVKGSKTEVLTEGVLVTYTRETRSTWYSLTNYSSSGVINVTFLNKDLTQDLPEYSLNVSNGISYTIIDFGVYNSDASLLLHSTAVCLLGVVVLQALLY